MTDVQVPAGERGATRIADKVVTKVAAQAAREALRGARAGDGRSAAGPPVRRTVPHAAVTVRERTARVRLGLELGYPSDIGAQCGAVRRRVISRVGELVGMDVPDVTLEIERLHSAHLKGGSSGRVT
ncbi:Asp23/Gls24 family envelope stress response protein [Streptomyces spirodelae]|uniref:Asp23/Gls24 family envelope stress response protein n=1 Tax=Streptomyces spirodelae TaxID=2812904 RepID=A0ABS3WZ14_9ACTN|nr:Asp23/Gls24 family envelope stress response protein [Streptomyces spirodelae]MBO8188372.1 Asp23/Gls24 family envelope stress response protein [Streptomyces spirodelae]